MVEKEMTAFIERRSHREPDPDELDPGYRESVRRFHDRRRRERRALWYGHHEHMRELHARLSAEHAEKAEKLLRGGHE